MKLHEENLKEIIKAIEKFGAIIDVKIINSSTVIGHPSPKSKQPRNSKLTEIDLDRPKTFEIKFIMGDEKNE